MHTHPCHVFHEDGEHLTVILTSKILDNTWMLQRLKDFDLIPQGLYLLQPTGGGLHSNLL